MSQIEFGFESNFGVYLTWNKCFDVSFGDNTRLDGEKIGPVIIIVNGTSIWQGPDCFGQKIEAMKLNNIANQFWESYAYI